MPYGSGPETKAKALAESIESLLTQPDNARTMGEQGRRAVTEKFSVGRMADGILEVLEEISLS